MAAYTGRGLDSKLATGDCSTSDDSVVDAALSELIRTNGGVFADNTLEAGLQRQCRRVLTNNAIRFIMLRAGLHKAMVEKFVCAFEQMDRLSTIVDADVKRRIMEFIAHGATIKYLVADEQQALFLDYVMACFILCVLYAAFFSDVRCVITALLPVAQLLFVSDGIKSNDRQRANALAKIGLGWLSKFPAHPSFEMVETQFAKYQFLFICAHVAVRDSPKEAVKLWDKAQQTLKKLRVLSSRNVILQQKIANAELAMHTSKVTLARIMLSPSHPSLLKSMEQMNDLIALSDTRVRERSKPIMAYFQLCVLLQDDDHNVSSDKVNTLIQIVRDAEQYVPDNVHAKISIRISCGYALIRQKQFKQAQHELENAVLLLSETEGVDEECLMARAKGLLAVATEEICTTAALDENCTSEQYISDVVLLSQGHSSEQCARFSQNEIVNMVQALSDCVKARVLWFSRQLAERGMKDDAVKELARAAIDLANYSLEFHEKAYAGMKSYFDVIIYLHQSGNNYLMTVLKVLAYLGFGNDDPYTLFERYTCRQLLRSKHMAPQGYSTEDGGRADICSSFDALSVDGPDATVCFYSLKKAAPTGNATEQGATLCKVVLRESQDDADELQGVIVQIAKYKSEYSFVCLSTLRRFPLAILDSVFCLTEGILLNGATANLSAPITTSLSNSGAQATRSLLAWNRNTLEVLALLLKHRRNTCNAAFSTLQQPKEAPKNDPASFDKPDSVSNLTRDVDWDEVDSGIDIGLYTAYLRRCYASFISPIEYLLPLQVVGTLAIVSSPAFHMIPFAQLMDEDGKMLFEKYVVFFAPAVRVLHRLTKLMPPARQSLNQPPLTSCIVGNPDLPVFLGSLPLAVAQREAAAVASCLHTSVKPLVGSLATKNKILEQLTAQPEIIHIACHGASNTPKFTLRLPGSIYVRPEDQKMNSEHPQDWTISSEEIQDLDLSTCRLVFLTICHGGTGDESPEGLLGLVAAFLYAGAKAVISSYTTVRESEVTLALVNAFYADYVSHWNAPKALQKAMLECYADHGIEQIHHWGCFYCVTGHRRC